jgi:hypothetical protein
MASRVTLTVALLALLCVRAADAQTLTLSQVEESIVAIGDIVQHEYVDRDVGRQVAASLREGLSEGRFPNLTTPGDIAEAMNHELQFLTHDKDLVVSVVRADQSRKSTSNTVRTFRVMNVPLEIAIPVKH